VRRGQSQIKEKGHHPSGVFRGHKADVYEGGHRVPFLAMWEEGLPQGQVSDQLLCTTDFLATCADIVGYDLADDEGEDSFSILTSIKDQSDQISREDIIHHSIDGEFAIRKGDWKLIMCPGSGGWSYPTKKQAMELDSLAPIQLFNLRADPGETENLFASEPEMVDELSALLIHYILNGRSTPGEKQANDPIDGNWTQINFIKE